MYFIHIGLGKTATTTLQQYVFPNISRVRPSVRFNNPDILSLLDKHVTTEAF